MKNYQFICSKFNNKKSFGFTLAEVLITLGIIGIVAAMTIPNLIIQYQKQQTAEQLKAFYSIMMQANQMSTIDNGEIKNWFTTEATSGKSAHVFAKTYLMPYLSVVKDCTGKTSSDCNYSTHYLSGIETGMFIDTDITRFYLKNGNLICMDYHNNVFFLYVDLNGSKGPNIWGRDIFVFVYGTSGFYAHSMGGSRDAIKTGTWGCNKSGTGSWSCSRIIQMDGWQIKDDYPW